MQSGLDPNKSVANLALPCTFSHEEERPITILELIASPHRLRTAGLLLQRRCLQSIDHFPHFILERQEG